MSYAYPHLKENENFIVDEIEKEEIKFRRTLEQGLKHLQKIIQDQDLRNSSVEFDGKQAFDLYETYGFPIEMTLDELNLSEDKANQLIEDFKEYNIKGLGISTLSKFLHLLEIKVENYEAIILDDRIINILNENEFDELQNLKNISREYSLRKVKAKTNYLEYLKNLNTLAKKLDTKSENIEMFLFFFGKNLY